MSKKKIFIGAAILVATGIVAFVVLSQRNQFDVSSAQFGPDEAAAMRKQDEAVLALFPLGTPFAKVVATWGDNYRTTSTNDDGTYYACFRCTLPGQANQSYVQLRIKNDAVADTGFMMLSYPYGHGK
ncbi:MAG TPA: hypothetical protein VMB22_05820 [Verrucomicrobiae bacterium]|nr:hypothetical protein [Verrucomicrobiae bacterium]